MVRKTKAEAEATRQAILDAATEIFWQQGVVRASLDQIARHAGVTRGAVYWHFKNKFDLLWALYEQLYVPFHEMVLTNLNTEHKRPLQQLEDLCGELFDGILEDEKRIRTLSIFMLKTDYSGDFDQILRCQNKRKAQSVDLFRTYFERAIKSGHLRADADPQLLTVSLISFITGITYELLRNPSLFVDGCQFKSMFRNFFAGLIVSDR